jgi:hypothetical protein
MNAKTLSQDASLRKPLNKRKPSMSSGAKFLKRKNDYETIEISRKNITDILAQWLHATRMIDDAHNITDIEFYPHTTNEDLFNLKVIHTNGGAKTT